MARADVTELELTPRPDGVRLSVRVKPRASRSRIVGIREGALEVAVAAPPVEGAANAELCRLLARGLGLRRSALSIASGASGRNKRVDIRGAEAAAVRRAIIDALDG